ncbi:hypothetical protein PG997_014324 [Apiospora hydei]|uniref:Uncharacterized protein n=1 Tax=Apiospora hydei TaxID=1337664 RepID=A0ABR1UU52_9PEZI
MVLPQKPAGSELYVLSTPIRLLTIGGSLLATILTLLFLLFSGTLIRSLGAREHLLGILDVLLLDRLLDRLEGLGRELIHGHLVHPRLDVALPLLLERDIGPHPLRVLRHARLALADVVLEGRDTAQDLDQGLNPLIDRRPLFLSLFLRRLLPAAGAEDQLRLVPGLGVLERQDAAPEVLALVVAAAEEALDQVEVVDDLGVAPVLALLDVEEGLLVAQGAVPLGDLDVPELLLGVLVAPVAVGGRGVELGCVFDLLLVDLLGVLVGLLGLGTGGLEGVALAPVAAAVDFFLPLGVSAGVGLLFLEGLPVSSSSDARFLLGGASDSFFTFFFSRPSWSSTGRFLFGDSGAGTSSRGMVSI